MPTKNPRIGVTVADPQLYERIVKVAKAEGRTLGNLGLQALMVYVDNHPAVRTQGQATENNKTEE